MTLYAYHRPSSKLVHLLDPDFNAGQRTAPARMAIGGCGHREESMPMTVVTVENLASHVSGDLAWCGKCVGRVVELSLRVSLHDVLALALGAPGSS